MQSSSRFGRRAAGAAAAVLLAGAGALASASPAAAKANLLAIDKVSLADSGLHVDVTYSCDPGEEFQLVAQAVKVTDEHISTRAAALVKPGDLVCDYESRTLRLKLRPELHAQFAKGDKAEVKVFYLDPNGFDYAEDQVTATL
ncbi:hypothetical protein [Streptomyces sp. NPDC053048]|uniref:hypothetical protein n=1 Tax=Streptomyces sp. NPDC053048 TaxID=3365694 RepID=UPI0037D0510F